MSKSKVLIGAATAFAVVVLAVGLYLGGWWLRKDTTDRRVGITNRNVGTQTAWHDEAIDLINQGALLPDNAPQAEALERQACELIGRLTVTHLDDTLAGFQAQECYTP